MSSSDRRAVLLAALALGACGFTPVYAPGGSGTALRGRIAFDPPEDTEGFALVRALERRLGLPEAPLYRLSATIRLAQDDAGITREQVVTRFRVEGQVDYALRRLSDDMTVASGRVRNFTGYSATGNTVAARTASADARERLMVLLADEIAADLLAADVPW